MLISGRGSNLQALIDAIASGGLNATIAVVISNRQDAGGLERARAAGIEAIVISHRDFGSRDDYDRALARELRARDVGVVCLAGFMRLVGTELIDAFPSRILNIHPSLLPAFPGLDAQKQAIEHGVRVSGVTVHLVTAELDGGPIGAGVPGEAAGALQQALLSQQQPRGLRTANALAAAIGHRVRAALQMDIRLNGQNLGSGIH